ncbi:MAG: CBS domain-containing protein [Oligoflexales bacterium]
MKQKESIKKLMSDDLVTGNRQDHFSDVKSKMEEHKIHHLPIVDGGKIVGIVSRTDIHKFSHSRAYIADGEVDHSLDVAVPVEKLMTQNPITIKDTDTIKHAVEILNEHSFNSVPVVEGGSQKLVGIVTSKDLMTYLVNLY